MPSEGQIAYRTEFLRSEFWQNLRLEVLARDKGECRVCKFASHTNDAHHVFYPKESWYESKPEILVTLCRDCHSLIHLMTDPSGVSRLKDGLDWFEDAANKLRSLMTWKQKKSLYFQQLDLARRCESFKKRKRKAPGLSERLILVREKSRQERLAKAQEALNNSSQCLLCKTENNVSVVDMSGCDHQFMKWPLCLSCWNDIDSNASRQPDGTRVFKDVRLFLKAKRKARGDGLKSLTPSVFIVNPSSRNSAGASHEGISA